MVGPPSTANGAKVDQVPRVFLNLLTEIPLAASWLYSPADDPQVSGTCGAARQLRAWNRARILV